MSDDAEVVTQIIVEPGSLIDDFEPREYPGRIGLWRAALQVPMASQYSSGRHGSAVEIPAEYREDQEFASYIGMCRAMGALCFKSMTRGGVALSQDEGFKVGDWVQIGKHQGEKYRTVDGTLWIVISDTQYIAVLDDPAAFDCMSL